MPLLKFTTKSCARGYWWTLDFANAFPGVKSRAELVPPPGPVGRDVTTGCVCEHPPPPPPIIRSKWKYLVKVGQSGTSNLTKVCQSSVEIKVGKIWSPPPRRKYFRKIFLGVGPNCKGKVDQNKRTPPLPKVDVFATSQPVGSGITKLYDSCFARYSGLNKWLQSPVEL
jgi:hypothetical protein